MRYTDKDCETVNRLLVKYGLECDFHEPHLSEDGSLMMFSPDGMPILPFFIELAAETRTPIEEISVDADDRSGSDSMGSYLQIEVVLGKGRRL